MKRATAAHATTPDTFDAARRRRRGIVLAALVLVTLGVFLARCLLGDFTVTIPDFVRILRDEPVDVPVEPADMGPEPVEEPPVADDRGPAGGETDDTKLGSEPDPATPAPGAKFTVTDIRRLWPEVLEEVKGKRRFTWILLSQNAQVAELRKGVLVLAMANAGARDSFARGGSEDVLREALVVTLGADYRIETLLDPASGSEAAPPPHARVVASLPTLRLRRDQHAAEDAHPLGAAVTGEGGDGGTLSPRAGALLAPGVEPVLEARQPQHFRVGRRGGSHRFSLSRRRREPPSRRRVRGDAPHVLR